jgi:hypothetical protein
VELLIDDALDEGFEWGLGGSDSEMEWACTLDELAEFRVAGCEFAAGASTVVARRAWVVAVMRHLLTVSQGAE